jgi:hypothetical protein
LVLFIIGNLNVQKWGGIEWHDVRTKLHENPLTGLHLLGGMHTDRYADVGQGEPPLKNKERE